jgi:hypothetical protein
LSVLDWAITRKRFGVSAIFLEDLFVGRETLGIIRNIAGLGFFAEFPERHGFFVLFPRREMFVFVDAGEIHFHSGVVDHRVALIIGSFRRNLLERHGAIAQPAFGIVEKRVDRAGVKDMRRSASELRVEIRPEGEVLGCVGDN